MKTVRILLLGLLTLTLLATPAVAPVPAFERAGDRKILVFAGRQEVPTIDPSVKYDWSIRMMQQALYDALVKYVGNPPEIVPWLAERWEVSPDAKTWTFHLVKNARFHSGDPAHAHAHHRTVARALRPTDGRARTRPGCAHDDGLAAVTAHAPPRTLAEPCA